jgi:hypothetical protein
MPEPKLIPNEDNNTRYGHDGESIYLAENEPQPEINPADPNSVEDLAKSVAEIKRLSQIWPSHEFQAELVTEYHQEIVNAVVAFVQTIPGYPQHIIDIIKGNSSNSADIARRLLTERNQLADTIIHTSNTFNMSLPDTTIERDNEGMRVIEIMRKLVREDSSNTDLLIRFLIQMGITYRQTDDSLVRLTSQYKAVVANVETLNAKVANLTNDLKAAEELRDRYNQQAGELAKFPLRGFSKEKPNWVIRHKREEDIYIGLSPSGLTRKPEAYLIEYVPVRTLAKAYRVVYQGTLSPPELRNLMEKVAERKFYQMFDPDDYGIEKITSQQYGS